MLPSRDTERLRKARRGWGPTLVGLLLAWGCAKPPPPAPPPRPPAPERAAPSPAPPSPGAIRGRIVPAPDAGGRSVAVYADPAGATAPRELPPREARIGGAEHAFTPSFLAVGVGQPVQLHNADEIFHRVFSHSEPNEFDAGMLAGGDERTIRFEHPGVVHLYCSLHENESAVIFVAPSPYFGTVEQGGEVELGNLPPGRYELRTWSESIPSASISVRVHPGRTTDVEIPIPADAGE